MCALFTLKVSYLDLVSSLDLTIEGPNLFETMENRFLPHQNAPVVRQNKGHLVVEMMNFSLIPHWSKERRPKFATHNARLETLQEKPTWKKPLQQNHCLVPLSEFIEPIYEGPHSGHMVGFSEQEDHVLWAAGLWEEWLDPNDGLLIPSFAIITHESSEFVKTMGHDREPLFLNKGAFDS